MGRAEARPSEKEEKLLQTRAERGPAFQLSGQSLDRSQSGRADVVFHPFDIMIDHAVVNTQQLEEVGQNLVTAAIFRASFSPAVVRTGPDIFVFEQASASSFCHHVVTLAWEIRRSGDIDHARVALGVDHSRIRSR